GASRVKVMDYFRRAAPVEDERKDPVVGPDLKIKNDGGPLENPNVPITPEQLAFLLSGGPTAAGVPVGERSSMRSPAGYAGRSLVTGLTGSLPLPVYEKTAKGNRLAEDHRLYPLLHDVPNADTALTSFIWGELMGVHLQLNGNHYSAIET